MHFNLVRFRAVIAAGALAVAAWLLTPSILRADTHSSLSAPKLENAVTTELQDLRSLMGKLNSDAGELEAFRHSPRLQWRTHADQLNQIRDHVNALGEQVSRLQKMKYASAEWQQRAIDLIVPVAVQVADRTQSAIHHLKENRGYLWAPDYVDHLQAISALSDKLYGTIDDCLEIAAAQQKIEQLDRRLAERIS